MPSRAPRPIERPIKQPEPGRWWLALLLLLLSSVAIAAPDFPNLTGRVTDKAQMISPQATERLDQMLAALEKSNGDQVAVVTVPDIGDTTIENYGYQLGRAWGIGDSKKDNGALLLIAKKQHAIRIEVGYGLEGQLTDARSAVIISRIIRPAFKKGNFDQGVLAGTAAIVKTLGGDPGAAGQTASHHAQRHELPSIVHTVLWVVLMIAIVFMTGGGGGGGFGRRRRRRGGLPWFIPIGGGGFGGGSGGFGGGFGGGGGFSGGGGSFGGGGASGGW